MEEFLYEAAVLTLIRAEGLHNQLSQDGFFSEASVSKNNFSKNDTSQSLQNLKACCGMKTLADWSALWNWHYYETVMARLLRQRETRAATQKIIANKAVKANTDGHYPNVSCAAVNLTDASCASRWHQRGSFSWPQTGVESMNRQVLFHRCGDAIVFSLLARHFWDQNSHEPQLCSLLITVFVFPFWCQKEKKVFKYTPCNWSLFCYRSMLKSQSAREGPVAAHWDRIVSFNQNIESD